MMRSLLSVREIALALAILVAFSSAAVPMARANLQFGEWSTSITDLRYSAETVYNLETPWVEATVTYQNAPTGWYLVIAVIDLQMLEPRKYLYWWGDINNIQGITGYPTWVDDSRYALVRGTYTGVPAECGSAFDVPAGVMLTVVPGYTWCTVPIGATVQSTYVSGSEKVAFQLSNLGPGIWKLRIVSALYLIRGGGYGVSPRTVSFRDFSLAVVSSRTTATTISQTVLTTPLPTTTTGLDTTTTGLGTTTSVGVSTVSARPETLATTTVAGMGQVSDSLAIAIAIVMAGAMIGLSIMLAMRRRG